MGIRVTKATLALGMVLATLVGVAPAAAADCGVGQFSVSGTVTDEATGLPLDRVTSVGFVSTGGTYADDQGTLPDSTFHICVPADMYVVQFFADGYFIEWHDDAAAQTDATILNVTADISGLDAALTAFPVITGRVTDSRTGLPLFTSVGITDAASGIGLDGEGTDTDGVYRFVVQPGTYQISFAADFHWVEWYDNAKKRSKATVITVTRTSGVITGIDAELRHCGRPVPDFCIPRNFNS